MTTKQRMTSEGLRERAERLREIREEMATLALEARELLEGTGEEDRAKAYWYAQVTMALDDDHSYLGSGTYTLEDSEQALEAQADELEEGGGS